MDFAEGDLEARAEFAVDLNDKFNGVSNEIFGVISRPSVVGI